MIGMNYKITAQEIGVVRYGDALLELLATNSAVMTTEDLVVGQQGETAAATHEATLEVGSGNRWQKGYVGFLCNEFRQARNLPFGVGGSQIVEMSGFKLLQGLSQKIQT